MTKQDIIRKLSSRRLWMSMVDEIAKLKRIVTGRGICSEWDEETFTELVDHVDVVRGESICFYLKCGMKLTERMAPPRETEQQQGRGRPS